MSIPCSALSKAGSCGGDGLWLTGRNRGRLLFSSRPYVPLGRSTSSVLPPMRWSPRRRRLDSEVGALALAIGLHPAPPDSGLSKARPSERERGGEQGRAHAVAQWPHSLDRLPHTPLGPPADAPAPSRLTGILRAPSHSRHRASDRGFASYPPLLDCRPRARLAVARPIAVGVAEVPRRARKDELAAAGAAHPPGGDEGGEPLPQRSVRATVAACLRGSTAAGSAGALELLGDETELDYTGLLGSAASAS